MQRVNNIDIEKYHQVVEKTGITYISSCMGYIGLCVYVWRWNKLLDVTLKEVASQISGLKEDLKEAQEVRKNKLEYDKEARKILQLETRETYLK